jgi:hypothetical protein
MVLAPQAPGKTKPLFNMHTPKIYFYFPKDFLARDLPNSLDGDWLPLSVSGVGGHYLMYVALRAYGFPCEAVSHLPADGILIGDASALQPLKWFPARLYVVYCQFDWPRHPFAHMHIVSNREMTKPEWLALADCLTWPGPRVCLPVIPQRGLIGRDPARGERFERVAYFGQAKNLAAPFRSPAWAERLRTIGVDFQIRGDARQFGDYRDVDAVLAIRGEDFPGHNKPHSKLWNSWRAGVPAILGPEYGYREQRRAALDYIEAESPDEAFAAIARLKGDAVLRRSMVENGFARAVECSPEAVVRVWVRFLEGELQEEYKKWLALGRSGRTAFRAIRHVRAALAALRRSF